jgi:hypothetical protein
MNIRTDDNGNRWVETLDDVKPEYTPIEAISPLSFFTLANKRTVMCKENLVPLTDVQYLVMAKAEDCFYVKTYRNYDVDTLLFYYKRNGNDMPEVENLLRYIYDGNVWLLFTPEMIEDMKAMLAKVYKSQFHKEGTLKYKTFMALLKESIDYEDYQDYGKALTGFKTVSRQFEMRIGELWKLAQK